jgi:hypothetical protein
MLCLQEKPPRFKVLSNFRVQKPNLIGAIRKTADGKDIGNHPVSSPFNFTAVELKSSGNGWISCQAHKK